MKKPTFTKYDVQAFLEEKLSNNTATDQEVNYYKWLTIKDKLTYNRTLDYIVTQMDHYYNN